MCDIDQTWKTLLNLRRKKRKGLGMDEPNDDVDVKVKILPGMHTHLNVPGSSRQDPSFLHGCESHSFTLVSQRGPVNPCGQLQANDPGVLTQTPSCSHGDPVKN